VIFAVYDWIIFLIHLVVRREPANDDEGDDEVERKGSPHEKLQSKGVQV
jgi:hypothetical protein